MARVTVEDCVEKVQNRFELILLAGQRCRKISSGSPLLVEKDNDKNPVIALREIAEEKLQPEDLKEELIRTHQRIVETDDSEDVIDMMDGEEEWQAMSAEAALVNAAAAEAEAEASAETEATNSDESAEEEEPSLADLAGSV